MTSTNLMTQVNSLKNEIKKAFSWDDNRLNEFWETPNPLLNERKPSDMTGNDYDFKRLKTLVKFSTVTPKGR